MSLCDGSTNKPKLQDTQLGSQKCKYLPEYLVRGLRSGRECRCGYVTVFENTSEKLILKSIFPLKVAVTLLSGSRKGKVEV